MSDYKYGTCPWCKKENRLLSFVMGSAGGKLWAGYVCKDCITASQDKDWYSNIFREEEKEAHENTAS